METVAPKLLAGVKKAQAVMGVRGEGWGGGARGGA